MNQVESLLHLMSECPEFMGRLRGDDRVCTCEKLGVAEGIASTVIAFFKSMDDEDRREFKKKFLRGDFGGNIALTNKITTAFHDIPDYYESTDEDFTEVLSRIMFQVFTVEVGNVSRCGNT